MLSPTHHRSRAGYHLVLAHGKQPIDRWSLPTDRPFAIGRAGDSETPPPDVVLWPDRRVSARHAQIWYASGAWWIEDVKSKNGTIVDGHPLAPHSPIALR